MASPAGSSPKLRAAEERAAVATPERGDGSPSPVSIDSRDYISGSSSGGERVSDIRAGNGKPHGEQGALSFKTVDEAGSSTPSVGSHDHSASKPFQDMGGTSDDGEVVAAAGHASEASEGSGDGERSSSPSTDGGARASSAAADGRARDAEAEHGIRDTLDDDAARDSGTAASERTELAAGDVDRGSVSTLSVPIALAQLRHLIVGDDPTVKSVVPRQFIKRVLKAHDTIIFHGADVRASDSLRLLCAPGRGLPETVTVQQRLNGLVYDLQQSGRGDVARGVDACGRALLGASWLVRPHLWGGGLRAMGDPGTQHSDSGTVSGGTSGHEPVLRATNNEAMLELLLLLARTDAPSGVRPTQVTEELLHGSASDVKGTSAGVEAAQDITACHMSTLFAPDETPRAPLPSAPPTTAHAGGALLLYPPDRFELPETLPGVHEQRTGHLDTIPAFGQFMTRAPSHLQQLFAESRPFAPDSQTLGGGGDSLFGALQHRLLQRHHELSGVALQLPALLDRGVCGPDLLEAALSAADSSKVVDSRLVEPQPVDSDGRSEEREPPPLGASPKRLEAAHGSFWSNWAEKSDSTDHAQPWSRRQEWDDELPGVPLCRGDETSEATHGYAYFPGDVPVARSTESFDAWYSSQYERGVGFPHTILSHDDSIAGVFALLRGAPTASIPFDDRPGVYAFRLPEGLHHPRTADTSRASLRSLFSSVARAGTHFRRLDSICEYYTTGASRGGQVVQSFCIALGQYLKCHEAYVLSLATRVTRDNEGDSLLGGRGRSTSTTILCLEGLMRPFISRLQVLARICGCDAWKKARSEVEGDDADVPGWLLRLPRGASLLSSLFDVADVASLAASESGSVVEPLRISRSGAPLHNDIGTWRLLRWLMARTCEPYMQILADWVFTGTIAEGADPHNEFMLETIQTPKRRRRRMRQGAAPALGGSGWDGAPRDTVAGGPGAVEAEESFHAGFGLFGARSEPIRLDVAGDEGSVSSSDGSSDSDAEDTEGPIPKHNSGVDAGLPVAPSVLRSGSLLVHWRGVDFVPSFLSVGGGGDRGGGTLAETIARCGRTLQLLRTVDRDYFSSVGVPPGYTETPPLCLETTMAGASRAVALHAARLRRASKRMDRLRREDELRQHGMRSELKRVREMFGAFGGPTGFDQFSTPDREASRAAAVASSTRAIAAARAAEAASQEAEAVRRRAEFARQKKEAEDAAARRLAAIAAEKAADAEFRRSIARRSPLKPLSATEVPTPGSPEYRAAAQWLLEKHAADMKAAEEAEAKRMALLRWRHKRAMRMPRARRKLAALLFDGEAPTEELADREPGESQAAVDGEPRPYGSAGGGPSTAGALLYQGESRDVTGPRDFGIPRADVVVSQPAGGDSTAGEVLYPSSEVPVAPERAHVVVLREPGGDSTAAGVMYPSDDGDAAEVTRTGVRVHQEEPSAARQLITASATPAALRTETRVSQPAGGRSVAGEVIAGESAVEAVRSQVVVSQPPGGSASASDADASVGLRPTVRVAASPGGDDHVRELLGPSHAQSDALTTSVAETDDSEEAGAAAGPTVLSPGEPSDASKSVVQSVIDEIVDQLEEVLSQGEEHGEVDPAPSSDDPGAASSAAVDATGQRAEPATAALDASADIVPVHTSVRVDVAAGSAGAAGGLLYPSGVTAEGNGPPRTSVRVADPSRVDGHDADAALYGGGEPHVASGAHVRVLQEPGGMSSAADVLYGDGVADAEELLSRTSVHVAQPSGGDSTAADIIYGDGTEQANAGVTFGHVRVVQAAGGTSSVDIYGTGVAGPPQRPEVRVSHPAGGDSVAGDIIYRQGSEVAGALDGEVRITQEPGGTSTAGDVIYESGAPAEPERRSITVTQPAGGHSEAHRVVYGDGGAVSERTGVVVAQEPGGRSTAGETIYGSDGPAVRGPTSVRVAQPSGGTSSAEGVIYSTKGVSRPDLHTDVAVSQPAGGTSTLGDTIYGGVYHRDPESPRHGVRVSRPSGGFSTVQQLLYGDAETVKAVDAAALAQVAAALGGIKTEAPLSPAAVSDVSEDDEAEEGTLRGSPYHDIPMDACLQNDLRSLATVMQAQGGAGGSLDGGALMSEEEATEPPSPLSVTVAQSVVAPIIAQAQLVDAAAAEVFLGRLQLGDHLRALRRYALMGAGHTMSLFCDALVASLTADGELDLVKPNWRVPGNLTAALSAARSQTGLEDDKFGDSFTYTVRRQGERAGDDDAEPWTLYALDFVQPRYSAPWPLSEVITGASRRAYYKAHTFLLRMRRVSFEARRMWIAVKHSTRAQRSLSPQDAAFLRWVHLFRREITHFLDTFESYVSSQVLDVCWSSFMTWLAEDAVDVRSIRAAHDRYVDMILRRCLLGPDAPQGMAVLTALFESILRFCSLVHGHPLDKPFPSELAEEMVGTQRSFRRYIRFLCKVLRRLANRGAGFTHMKDLLARLDFSGFYEKRPGSD